MNIHRALSDIAEIRAQLTRTEVYQGFRSTAVGISVLVLVVGVWIEGKWVPEPLLEVGRFLAVWMGVALVSGIVAIAEMVIRGRKSENQMVWKVHRSLGRQIIPSLLVGLSLTVLIVAHALEQASSEVPVQVLGRFSGEGGMVWALPGIWALVYGLGLFSCERHLPQQSAWVAAFFLCSGAMVLVYGWTTHELAGWQMLVTFGVGQFLLAGVFFRDSERWRNE